MKVCPTCKELLNFTNFHKEVSKKDGLQRICKICQNSANRKSHKKDYRRVMKNNLKKRFGISLEQYDNMLQSQKNVCAICKNKETLKSTGRFEIKQLSVDHCHSSLKIRGLLCSLCNTSLGGFKDSIELLESAILYLRKHSDKA